MNKNDKKPPVIIHLLKSDDKYKVVEPNEFHSNTSFSIPKNLVYQEPTKNQSKIDRKTRDSNKNAKSYAQLENIKLPVQYSNHQPPVQKPTIQTVIYEPTQQKVPTPLPQKRTDIFPYTNFQEQKQERENSEHISEPPIEDSPEFKQKLVEQQQRMQLAQLAQLNKQNKKYGVIIPSCAHWFDISSIHQIEKDGLCEFFQGKPSKSPEVYMKYRNYIIQLYRQNPRTYLSATASRRNLAGDVCSILRIHSFLEYWGLINFNIDPKTQPQPVMSVKPLIQFDQFSKYDEQIKKFDSLDKDREMIENYSEGDLILNSIKMLSKSIRPICDFCGMICSLFWYQQRIIDERYDNSPQLILCIKCFTEKNFPDTFSEKDFVKMDLMNKLASQDNNKVNSKPWLPDETIKLLDLIDNNGDNWEEIVKNFGSQRTREEIILHFLQLPLKNITNIKIFENEENNDDLLQKKSQFQQLVEEEPSVFSDFSNPLLQHVAIFKTLLDKQSTTNPLNNLQNHVVKPIITQGEEAQKEPQQAPLFHKRENEEKLNHISALHIDKNNDPNHVLDQTLLTSQAQFQKTTQSLQKTANILLENQIQKLEHKMQYLEEYEKLVIYEKNQLEVMQRFLIGESVFMANKKRTKMEVE